MAAHSSGTLLLMSVLLLVGALALASSLLMPAINTSADLRAFKPALASEQALRARISRGGNLERSDLANNWEDNLMDDFYEEEEQEQRDVGRTTQYQAKRYGETEGVKPEAIRAARRLWEQLDESKALPPWDERNAKPQFLQADGNPCWTSDSGKNVCLPLVHVIGPFQCATDDLLARLKHHPAIKVGRTSKSHFFYEPRTIVEATSHFVDHADALAASSQADGGKHDAVGIDASPGTFSFYLAHTADRTMRKWKDSMGACHKECHSDGRGAEAADACMDERCFERGIKVQQSAERELGARVEVPHLVKAMQGSNVRLVAMLRNPVDRLHASFYFHDHYRMHYGANPEGFRRFANETVSMMRLCRRHVAARSLVTEEEATRECALRFETHGMVFEKEFFHCDQAIRSLYDVFAETWADVFSGGELLLLKAEDYFERPADTLQAVADHLQIRAFDGDVLQRALREKLVRNADGRRDSGSGPGGSPAGTIMDASTRALLEEFYAPHNRRLQQIVAGGAVRTLAGTTFTWGYE